MHGQLGPRRIHGDLSNTTGARLSTTSEGLWLAAALAGVTRLPDALRVRPIGAVDRALPGHPGLKVLEDQGVCSGRRLDADVDRWMWTLGRPDLQITITVQRPHRSVDRTGGPPRVFDPGVDPLREPIRAYEALLAWNARFGPRRSAVLCCRNGEWVSAARLWQPTQAPDPGDGGEAGELAEIDDIVVTDLGHCDPAVPVNDIIGREHGRAEFAAINQPAGVIEAALARWQQNPGVDLVGELRERGLTTAQARVVQSASDASATQIVVSATQFAVDATNHAPYVVTVIDTAEGRVVKSDSQSPDGQRWITLAPGGTRGITAAVTAMCASLPSGANWMEHRRERRRGA